MFKVLLISFLALNSAAAVASGTEPRPASTLELLKVDPENYQFRLCEGSDCRLLGGRVYTRTEIAQAALVDIEKASRVSPLLSNGLFNPKCSILIGVALAVGSGAFGELYHLLPNLKLFLTTSATSGALSLALLSPAWAPLLERYRYSRTLNDKRILHAALKEEFDPGDKELRGYVVKLERTLKRIDRGLYCKRHLENHVR